MSEVKGRRLGDIVTFKRGYDLPLAKRLEGSYPVISSSGVSGFHAEYKQDGEGVITGRYGTLGEVYYVNGRYWPHNTALYATSFHGNDPKYVFYLMKCLGNLKTSDKSTVPGINRNELHEIIVPFQENKWHQKQIAEILSALDDKISINNSINAELEALAKTIYDYWFVQFDFPDANGRPYKASGGKMVYNEMLKREVPVGWETDCITSVCELKGGGTPSKKVAENWNGDIPFFTPTDCQGDVFALNTADYITTAGLNNCSSDLFDAGTVFITARGSVGRLSIAGTPMAMNQSCYAFVPHNGVGTCYLYFLTKALIRHLEVKSTGSVFNSIVSNDIYHTSLLVPNRNLIKTYSKTIAPMFDQIKQNMLENVELARLRDWLLPLLMNGQVIVSQKSEQIRYNEDVNKHAKGISSHSVKHPKKVKI